jgi:hypothetical protein
LLPPGAPPEAAKTMQDMMGGATGAPKGGSFGGATPPAGAPGQPANK